MIRIFNHLQKGKTEITTSEGFLIFGEDIIFNNSKKIIL